jgi:hypothetical protein
LRILYVKAMKKASLLAAFLAVLSGAPFPTPVGGRVPVLLELFTSEGCSSCPPADRLLATFDEKQPVPGAELIVLSEHVDYWNQLGWKDPFSSQAFSARQQEYTDKFHMDGVYTPQLVVDGTFAFVGSDAHEAESAIREAIRADKADIAISNVSVGANRVTAHIELQNAPQGGSGILYVVLADNRDESHVGRGENAGRALTHVAVARVLDRVGKIDLVRPSGRDVSVDVPSGIGRDGMRLVAFLQDAKSGRVLGAALRKL